MGTTVDTEVGLRRKEASLCKHFFGSQDFSDTKCGSTGSSVSIIMNSSITLVLFVKFEPTN